MTALLPWLVSTFGSVGAALIVVVLLFFGFQVIRYGFWLLVGLALAWYVGVDLDTLRRERERMNR